MFRKSEPGFYNAILMDAHLSKPVEPDRLYETMARLIMERTAEEVKQDAEL
ncbi:MAG: hypothetical protein IJ619_07290 [Eubacterium sp.]|nr:hypothetical protein [Eubacterium sp.]